VSAYAVQVDGAPHTIAAGTRSLGLLRNGPTPNTDFNVREVVNAIGRPLTPVEDDWLDLLHSLHIADLVCRRGQNEGWHRDIVLALPLRDPALFQPAIPIIQEVFGMMTFDRLQLEFSQHAAPPPARFPTTSRQTRPDAVALLSGGLDSACAGAQLAEHFQRPMFVSSRSSSHVSAAQNAVMTRLRHLCPGAETVHFKSAPKHTHATAPLPESDLSQRSRTLLYVGVAALIASAHSLPSITIGENGIMAINCPLTIGRAAGFSTRTAHPDVLRKMEELFERVFQRNLRIDNPLLPLTKADVVKELVKLAGPAIVKKTHSCWIARQAAHCGHCVPCVVRRLATESAGVPDVSYGDDLFANPDRSVISDAFANIADYLLFVRRLMSSSDEELLFEYPDLNIRDDGDGAVGRVLKTHRRWARQVERVIRKHGRLAALY
jgi:7-cyano-7-deazaguanine synthase in queuosine biosynthesis